MWADSAKLAVPLQKSNLKIQTFCYRMALLTTLFAFSVAVLGAYTRLTDAGLGCPDWPGCYGQLVLSPDFEQHHQSIAGFNLKKAWTEMAHRYLAGTLGLLIFVLAACLHSKRSNHSNRFNLVRKIALLLVGLVIFQALLGMWTVTLKLFPAVVMAHLLGGLSMLALLYWLSLSLGLSLKPLFPAETTGNHLSHSLLGRDLLRGYKIWAVIALMVLILQLFLGGWTSANYAALVCLDFPACFAGQYFPTDLNLNQAFNLFAKRNTAGITIHMAHRLGALLTALVSFSLCFKAYLAIPVHKIRRTLITIVSLLTLQILLGILNVIALLPLPIAVAHHAVAALLLLALVQLNFQLYHFEYYAK